MAEKAADKEPQIRAVVTFSPGEILEMCRERAQAMGYQIVKAEFGESWMKHVNVFVKAEVVKNGL